MMSKHGNNSSRKKDHRELLLKATSRSLFLHNPTPKFLFSSAKDGSKSASRLDFSDLENDSASRVSEDKKSFSTSRFKWKKPLKALSHFGQQRFNCSFFLHVRSIEGLPSSFNGISLCVHWKRKDKVLQTCSTRVIQGTADFDETLMQRCCVYVARSGQRWAKYGEKLSMVYLSVVGAPGIDIGKHWIDLTRILPITLEELSGEKSSGKWTTNLKLKGRAEGAFLNVTFSFAALRDPPSDSRHLTERESGIFQRNEAKLRRVGSTPSTSNRSPFRSWSSELDTNWEVMQSPDLLLSYPTDSLYRKLKEGEGQGKAAEPDSFSEQKQGYDFDSGYVNEFDGEKCEQIKFTVTEKGVEMSKEEHHKTNQDENQIIQGSQTELLEVQEKSNYTDTSNDEEVNCTWKNVICTDCEKDVSECNKDSYDKINDEEGDCNWKNVICGDFVNDDVSDCNKDQTDDSIEESEIKEMEYHHHIVLNQECMESKCPTATSILFEQDNYGETKSSYSADSVNRKLPSQENTDESIGKVCLDILGVDDNIFSSISEHDPESPRERLLREFEKEALASGSFILDLYASKEPEEFTYSCRNDPCSENISEGTTANLSADQGTDKHERSSQSVGDRPKSAHYIESGEPMKPWSFYKKESHTSTNCCYIGPVCCNKQPESPIQPSLSVDSVGPVIWTKDGGILHSMYPKLLKNVKHGASLNVQVSRLIVLPAEMGSRIMDILQSLASLDIEKLSAQLERLLPLEESSEKSMQPIANRAGITAPAREQYQAKLQNEPKVYKDKFGENEGVQNLLAAQAQSHGIVNSNSTVTNVDQEIALSQNLASLVMKRTEFLLLEGLKIQCGMSDEDAPARINLQLSKKTFPSRGRSSIFGRGNQPIGIGGLELLITDTDDDRELDHLFSMSVALDECLTSRAGKIYNGDQLSEQTSELLAVQGARCIDSFTIAVRVQLRDPSQNMDPVGIPMLAFAQVERSSVSVTPGVSCIGKSLEEENDKKEVIQEDNAEDFPSGFKIIGINVAGLHRKEEQQRSGGAHWSVASDMGKADKYQQHVVESKPIVTSSEQMLQPRDILWSISSHTPTECSTFKEFSVSNSHVRNPDIILPEAGIRVHAPGFF